MKKASSKLALVQPARQPPPEWLTAGEAAELLRIAKNTIYLLAARGELPGAKRFGKHLRIRRSALLGDE